MFQSLFIKDSLYLNWLHSAVKLFCPLEMLMGNRMLGPKLIYTSLRLQNFEGMIGLKGPLHKFLLPEHAHKFPPIESVFFHLCQSTKIYKMQRILSYF